MMGFEVKTAGTSEARVLWLRRTEMTRNSQEDANRRGAGAEVCLAHRAPTTHVTNPIPILVGSAFLEDVHFILIA